jgi:hypothetical protein
VAIVAVLLSACSGDSSGPPTTPAPSSPPVTTAPPTTRPASPRTTAPTTVPPASVASTILPFAGGINGPVSPGSTEPASR